MMRTFQSLEEVESCLDTLTVEEAEWIKANLNISFEIGENGAFTHAFEEPETEAEMERVG